jgi:hypothetical protein
MLKEGAERLAMYCKQRTGDSLRSVTIYRPDGTTRVYSDDMLRERYTEEQVSALVESAIELNTTLHHSNVPEAPLGRPIAGVYSFEEAFVMQFPWDETSGIVVTFDVDVGSSLSEFIDECHSVMHGDSPGDES